MNPSDRADALGALYAADTTNRDDVDTSGLSARAAHLAESTMRHREELDNAITAAGSSWRIDRMAAVDRNILRLATFELLHTDLSIAVIIDEAVRLAKEFSTANSGRFVNGVLDAIAAEARDRTEPSA